MSRLDRLYRSMEQAGLAALALVPSPNLRYLTGLAMHPSERLALAILPLAGDPALLLPQLEVPRARERLAVEVELFPWSDDQGPEPAIRRLREQLGLGGERIGVEERHMRLLEWHALQRAVPLCLVEPADGLLTEQRITKDDKEITCMRRAIAALEKGLQATLERLRPGMSELQAARAWQWAVLEAGVESAEEPIVMSGLRGASPHTTATDKPLQRGELVAFDGVATVGGYFGDITRTVALGEPGEELRRIHELVLQANTAGRAAVGPGIVAEEVDRAARRVIEKGGYGEFFLHRTGHGLGLEVHEPPDMVEGNKLALRPGMTFTVEPGIYVEGLGGVRIEDDMLVTDRGAESLTTMPRELLIL